MKTQGGRRLRRRPLLTAGRNRLAGFGARDQGTCDIRRISAAMKWKRACRKRGSANRLRHDFFEGVNPPRTASAGPEFRLGCRTQTRSRVPGHT